MIVGFQPCLTEQGIWGDTFIAANGYYLLYVYIQKTRMGWDNLNTKDTKIFHKGHKDLNTNLFYSVLCVFFESFVVKKNAVQEQFRVPSSELQKNI